MIFKLSLKNIWRNKRRTFITLAVIVTGVSMITLAMAYVEFVKWGYGEGIIHGPTGHFQIQNRALLEQDEEKILSLGLENWQTLAEQVAKDSRVEVVLPRIGFFGLVSTGEKSTAVMVQAVQPEKEIALGGRWIDPKPFQSLQGEADGIILGGLLAKSMGVKEGDSITLMTTTSTGALNAWDFKVVGLYRPGVEELEKRMAIMQLGTAQQLLASSKVERLVVGLKETESLPAALADWNGKLPQELVLRHWQDVFTDFQKTMNFLMGMVGFLLPVLMLVVWFSTMNTIFMALMERSNEFATLRAMGTSKGRMFGMLVSEGAWIGSLGIVLGIIIELGLAWLINGAGIMMPPPPGSSVGYALQMRNTVGIFAFIAPLTFMVVLLSTLVPARRIFKLNIVKALRNG